MIKSVFGFFYRSPETRSTPQRLAPYKDISVPIWSIYSDLMTLCGQYAPLTTSVLGFCLREQLD